jgi:hypothetical protein
VRQPLTFSMPGAAVTPVYAVTLYSLKNVGD